MGKERGITQNYKKVIFLKIPKYIGMRRKTIIKKIIIHHLYVVLYVTYYGCYNNFINMVGSLHLWD